jgi:RNA-binding protein YlmH
MAAGFAPISDRGAGALNGEELLKRRFAELSQRAYSSGVPVYTAFLNIAEQALLQSLRLPACPYALWGGAEGCERRVARFSLREADDGEWPIKCLLIEPRGKKFSEALTHRDFLGAVLALGIERGTVGDIVVREKSAYLLCLEGVARFIADNLGEVRRTAVYVNEAPPSSPARFTPCGRTRCRQRANGRTPSLQRHTGFLARIASAFSVKSGCS